ncbi:unnamed protein product [Blepharisma stoltei]|uniref:Uncharacterized protein n=1 Tax=Blepharisma stoltei TaxID=1481888 RepID=A0AAU9KN23_9CILI|nr:unnamed protein product [Blepharisma stoltei]
MDPNKLYKGITDCFKRLYHEQEFLSFWVEILQMFWGISLNFAIKDFLINTLKNMAKKKNFGSLSSLIYSLEGLLGLLHYL